MRARLPTTNKNAEEDGNIDVERNLNINGNDDDFDSSGAMKKKKSKVSSSSLPSMMMVPKNPWLLLVLGILFGAFLPTFMKYKSVRIVHKHVKGAYKAHSEASKEFLSLSIHDKSHAMMKGSIKGLHRNVKNAYRAHNVARKEYLRSYREAYLESILASTTKEEQEQEQEQDVKDGQDNNNTLDEYGLPLGNSWFSHVHIMKTAGSSFAKDIARRYYGACGNKGVSCMEELEDTEKMIAVYQKDTCSTKENSIWSTKNAEKRGYHNCAIVSEEIHMSEWSKWILNSIIHKNATKVALIPCRDPVSHFFSMNNYRNANVTKMFEDGKSCEEVLNNETIFYLLEPQRFQIDMDNPTAPWDKLVLFKFDAIESVLRLLDKHLPLRNFPLESKKSMRSNKDRNPKNEQLNKCSEHDLALEMKKLWSYYEFCEKNLPEGRDIAVVEVQTT